MISDLFPKYFKDAREFKSLGEAYDAIIQPLLDQLGETFSKCRAPVLFSEYELRPILIALGYDEANGMSEDDMRSLFLDILKNRRLMTEAAFVKQLRRAFDLKEDGSDWWEMKVNVEHNPSVTVSAPFEGVSTQKRLHSADSMSLVYDILVANLKDSFPAGVRLLLNATGSDRHTWYAGAVPTVTLTLINDVTESSTRLRRVYHVSGVRTQLEYNSDTDTYKINGQDIPASSLIAYGYKEQIIRTFVRQIDAIPGNTWQFVPGENVIGTNKPVQLRLEGMFDIDYTHVSVMSIRINGDPLDARKFNKLKIDTTAERNEGITNFSPVMISNQQALLTLSLSGYMELEIAYYIDESDVSMATIVSPNGVIYQAYKRVLEDVGVAKYYGIFTDPSDIAYYTHWWSASEWNQEGFSVQDAPEPIESFDYIGLMDANGSYALQCDDPVGFIDRPGLSPVSTKEMISSVDVNGSYDQHQDPVGFIDRPGSSPVSTKEMIGVNEYDKVGFMNISEDVEYLVFSRSGPYQTVNQNLAAGATASVYDEGANAAKDGDATKVYTIKEVFNAAGTSLDASVLSLSVVSGKLKVQNNGSSTVAWNRLTYTEV